MNCRLGYEAISALNEEKKIHINSMDKSKPFDYHLNCSSSTVKSFLQSNKSHKLFSIHLDSLSFWNQHHFGQVITSKLSH